MSTIKGNKPGYSVNHQHDYSTVKTSFGNYTGSWGGEKVSGQLCSIKVNLLNRFRKYTDDFVKAKKGTYGDAMESLMNEFTTVVPEVLTLSKVEEIVVGDEVRFNDPFFIKKYPGAYIVYKVNPKTIYIDENGIRCGFEKYTLTKTGKTGSVYANPVLFKGVSIIITNNESLGKLTVLECSKTKVIVVNAEGKKYSMKPQKSKFTIV